MQDRPEKGLARWVVDYSMGVNEAMELLLSLGHRRIGFISGPQALKSARIRSSAFLRSLGRYGIDEDKRLVGEGNRRMDGGLEAMARMLGIALFADSRAGFQRSDCDWYDACGARACQSRKTFRLWVSTTFAWPNSRNRH